MLFYYFQQFFNNIFGERTFALELILCLFYLSIFPKANQTDKKKQKVVGRQNYLHNNKELILKNTRYLNWMLDKKTIAVVTAIQLFDKLDHIHCWQLYLV